MQYNLNLICLITIRNDMLPMIPPGESHFTSKLSVRVADGPNLVSTNFTFFDCNSYSSCTECVSSPFPCDWCVDGKNIWLWILRTKFLRHEVCYGRRRWFTAKPAFKAVFLRVSAIMFFFFLHKRRYQHLHDVEKGFSFILPRFLAAHQKVSHCES